MLSSRSIVASNEPFPVDKLNYILFERLSVTSHHYCDVLLLYDSNSESTSKEIEALRTDIFNLIISSIKLIKDRLDIINTELSFKDKRSDRLNLVTEDNYKTEKNVLKNELLLFLKRGSEAGNDLYGVSSDYKRKVEVADYVFSLLNVSILFLYILFFSVSTIALFII